MGNYTSCPPARFSASMLPPCPQKAFDGAKTVMDPLQPLPPGLLCSRKVYTLQRKKAAELK